MRLVFVYNADSGLFNALIDFAHKTFSPQTYQCNLCAITYSMFGMKKDWQEFLKTLELPLEFLHKDELLKKYKIENPSLPAIYLKADHDLLLWITTEEINRCASLIDLQQRISTKLAKLP